MKKLVTRSYKWLLIGLLIPMYLMGNANAQAIVEPPDGESLTPLPFIFNMDSEEIDWENDYTLWPFSQAVLERIENPDKSGVNESDYVLSYEKPQGADAWAGFFYLLDDVAEITSESVFKLKVWSPRADIQALFKLEVDGTEDSTGDLFADVNEADEWVELEWDLSGVDGTVPWDKVVVIMDLDEHPVGTAETWYLDDFRLEGFGEATSSEVVNSETPDRLQLNQNYPNPFNPVTTIEFALPATSHIHLSVYNLQGQRVAVLKNEQVSAGQHSVSFDAGNLASGTYIYRLQAGEQVMSRSLTLVK